MPDDCQPVYGEALHFLHVSKLLHVADNDIDDGSGAEIMHLRGETMTVQYRCNDQVSLSENLSINTAWNTQCKLNTMMEATLRTCKHWTDV